MIFFSIIMPTYNQCFFIRRAINSLLSQQYGKWELIIINDGCTDNTEDIICEFLKDCRITYLKNDKNRGLGYALNQGIGKAKYDYIAYLPSDDYYLDNHLQLLSEEFIKNCNIVLVYTGAESKIIDSVSQSSRKKVIGLFADFSLQLVQVAHKKTDDKWLERSEYVTEDLFRMFWHNLIGKGYFSIVLQDTCYWTIHPHQRHCCISEKYGGGLNIYRRFYNVSEPIKLRVSTSKFINEEELYKVYRNAKIEGKGKKLKILLLGELAYNPERICALEEKGHDLYGLWIINPTFSFSTVGPLPFGNVKEISYNNWEEEIKQLKPDIIYGMLNFGAVPLAYEVLKRNLGIPFVWHFKEGPFICQERGRWEQLMYLYHNADGKIYINPEIKEWYEQFIPSKGLSLILDGDLPKKNYFTNDFSIRLSESDGEIHTVVPGRLIGVTIDEIKFLASKHIHIHLYVENYLENKQRLINNLLKDIPQYFHFHPHCSMQNWVSEFSQYDAGWLHCFNSTNKGCIRYATWDDLNMPARMNTLAAAGLPMIQKDNKGHIVAMQSHIQEYNMGIFFKTYTDLVVQLNDRNSLDIIKKNVLKNRMQFSFDKHVDALLSFFYNVIKSKNEKF